MVLVKRLGKVLHVSKSGRLIVRAEHVPKLYSRVYDEKMRAIGRVYDVMGPVAEPYVSVEVNPGVDPSSLVGKQLLVIERAVKRSKRRGRRW